MIAIKLYARPAMVFTLSPPDRTTDGDGNITRLYARPKLVATSSPLSHTPSGVHYITAGSNTEPAVLKFITASFEMVVIASVYHQQRTFTNDSDNRRCSCLSMPISNRH